MQQLSSSTSHKRVWYTYLTSSEIVVSRKKSLILVFLIWGFEAQSQGELKLNGLIHLQKANQLFQSITNYFIAISCLNVLWFWLATAEWNCDGMQKNNENVIAMYWCSISGGVTIK